MRSMCIQDRGLPSNAIGTGVPIWKIISKISGSAVNMKLDISQQMGLPELLYCQG